MRTTPFVLGGLLLLTACKADRAAPAPAPSASVTTRSAVVLDPVAAVKAKLPKNDPKLLTFELTSVSPKIGSGRGTYVFVKPVEWKVNEDLGTVRPPEGTLGFRTSLSVGSDCDGYCVSKDWSALIEAKLKKTIEDSPTTHDETTPDGRRIRWQTIGENAYFSAAWFTPGASFYYSCSGALEDKRLLVYLDAFLEICRTARGSRPS